MQLVGNPSVYHRVALATPGSDRVPVTCLCHVQGMGYGFLFERISQVINRLRPQ